MRIFLLRVARKCFADCRLDCVMLVQATANSFENSFHLTLSDATRQRSWGWSVTMPVMMSPRGARVDADELAGVLTVCCDWPDSARYYPGIDLDDAVDDEASQPMLTLEHVGWLPRV